MKRLVKSAPTANNYRSDYAVSFGLIEVIAKDTTEPWSVAAGYPALSRDEVLTSLVNGETIKVMNPFGTEVLWTLEDEKPEVRIIDAGYELISVYRGFHIGYVKNKGYAAYKKGETFSHQFARTVTEVQRMIDKDINEIFNNWFDRLNECLVELDMEPETDRRARSADFFHNRTPEEAAERMKKANRYTVEQQADGTWAIFNRGGFVRGGYLSCDRDTAVAAATEMADGDEEAGVPVASRAV